LGSLGTVRGALGNERPYREQAARSLRFWRSIALSRRELEKENRLLGQGREPWLK
jgi:hypothetical protein